MARFVVGVPSFRECFANKLKQSIPSVGTIAIWVSLSLVPFLGTAWSQDPSAGILPLSTQAQGISESVDLASSNINVHIPLRNKIGKLPFSYNFAMNSGAYVGLACEGNCSGWWADGGSNESNLLPRLSLGASEGYTTTNLELNCEGTNYSIQQLSDFYIKDSTGAVHAVQMTTLNPNNVIYSNAPDNPQCYSSAGTGTTTDGSNYTLVAVSYTYTQDGTNFTAPIFTIYDTSGNAYEINFTGSQSYTVVQDPDGATINQTYSNYIYQLTDTLNTTAITNTASAEYNDAAGNPRQFQQNTSSYTQQTNFGCSGIQDIAPTVLSFLSSITTPTGTISFTYETTPGDTHTPHYITGRLASITYTSGASVSYTYSGGNNGINCSSWAVPTLTKTVTDKNGNVSTWTYVNSNTGQPPSEPYEGYNVIFTVKVTDPAQNQTVYTFSQEAQTEVQYYQGTATGTPLKTVVTCYNNVDSSQSACVNNNQATGGNPTQVYTYFGSSAPSLVSTTYDTYRNVTQVANYDYGAAYPPSSSTTLLSTTTTVYDNPSGGSYPCGTLSNAYINNRPCSITTTNSSGVTVSKTSYTYNSTGHAITTSQFVNSSKSLGSSATYANGVLTSVTDVNGIETQYSNGPGVGACNGILPVKTTDPQIGSVQLTTSETWDCNGAVVTSTTDPNGAVTQTNYLVGGVADPLYRPLSVVDPEGNTTSLNYLTPTTFESTMNFNGTTSTTDTLATSDGLGRQVIAQVRQGQGLSTFDSTQAVYGWMSSSTGTCVLTGTFTTGACTTTSMPYSNSAGQPAPTGTKVTATQYDAIGRPLTITDGGGGTTSYTYVKNDVLQSVGPTPTFQKQLQYDGVGRLTSVCEITSSSGSGPCNQVNGGYNGFFTTYAYTYSSSGNLIVTVKQNNQTNAIGGTQVRTYTYDGLNRLISETNPEWGPGTANYTYDSDSTGTCAGPYNGDLVKKVDNAGNVTCFTYDSLHRKLTATYLASNPNPSPNKTFVYDTTSFSCTPNSGYTNGSYVKGRLVEGFTVSGSGGKITDTAYCYSPRGEMSDEYELVANSTTYYHTAASYWANGALSALNGVPQHSNGWTFGVDGEGRPNTATDATTSTNLVTAAMYYPTSSQTIITLGSGDKDTYSYDMNTGRMNQYQFTIGTTPKNIIGALNWNANWTLGSLVVTDPFNSADTQTCGYSYDSLARLQSVSCGPTSANGATWGQAFSYDAFGNISKTVPPSMTGISFAATYYPISNGNGNPTNNREQTVSSCAPTYDANGNLTTDCTFLPYPYTYAWDADGNITGINLSDNYPPISIIYDAFDRAVQEDNSGTYSEILYSPIGKTGIMANQTANNVFIPLPGGEQATYTNSTLRYRHYDWLGSARAESAATPPLIGDVAYAPFGETYSPDPSSPMYVSFTGQQPDTTSTPGQDTTPPGLYDFLYREYNPTQGRWTSPDPSGLGAVDPTNPQSWNRYAYSLNNPLAYVDPLGLFCVWDDGSYDSEDDPTTGDSMASGGTGVANCGSQGGTWFNGLPSDWDPNAGDWSGQASGEFADWAQAINPNGVGDDWMADGTGASVFGVFIPVVTNISSVGGNLTGACPAQPLAGNPPVTTQFWATDASHPQHHLGRDYAVPSGTPVFAPYPGNVGFAGSAGTFGNLVVITNPTWNVYLGHLSSIQVTTGKSVNAGDQVGLSGNTGHSTGPHLHFEQHTAGPIWQNGHAPRATAVEPCD
jgi:RHS repeat-associated protein